MPNILVVGSVNMDAVAVCPRPAAPGETLSAAEVKLVPGGKGANAAVAAARMGATVRMVGAVGDDAFGPVLRQGLEDNGVDTRWLATLPGASGVALILVDRASGQNTIVIGAGANAAVVPPEDDEPFRWADVVVMPLEIPVATVMETARRAQAAGVKVLLDPAPARTDLPDELWGCCDWISPNEGELALLSGVGELPGLPDAAFAGGAPEPLRRAAETMRQRGVGEVVAKLGSRGAYWLADSHERLGRARRIVAVDTTAAGDAFTGALAVALAEGTEREEALARALAAGTLACTRAGAQPSLPTRAEVDAWRCRD